MSVWDYISSLEKGDFDSLGRIIDPKCEILYICNGVNTFVDRPGKGLGESLTQMIKTNRTNSHLKEILIKECPTDAAYPNSSVYSISETRLFGGLGGLDGHGFMSESISEAIVTFLNGQIVKMIYVSVTDL